MALDLAFALDTILAFAKILLHRILAFAKILLHRILAFAKILLHRILDAHKNRPRGSEKWCHDIAVEGVL